MATKDQKHKALKRAIDIAKEQARGGGTGTVSVLKNAYATIVEIIDKIEQSQD